ncbi:MAG: hypothetical protein AAB116_01815 [Candidatus Poribacteria bacterium]
MKTKRLKWVKPALVELGNYKKASFGSVNAICNSGTGELRTQ